MLLPDVFIVGCGYVGTHLADVLLNEYDDVEVMALVHSQESHQRLQELGILTVPGDLEDAKLLSELPIDGTLLYYFAPPPSQGVKDTRLANLLSTLKKPSQFPQKVVLISTTAVYGDCQGDWVDESRPINPQTERAKRRADAEQQLISWATTNKVPYVILRVAGIYGAERLPEARLKAGLPVLKESESPFSNRIHVEDLVEVCLAMGELEATGIFNVSDGHPTTMTDYFNQVADALKLPRPPQISRAEAGAQLSEEMLSYLAESRRVKIDKLVKAVGLELRYPTLAEGLAAG